MTRPRIRAFLQLRARITLQLATVLALVLVATGLMVDRKVEQETRGAPTEKLVLLSRAAAESELVIQGLRGRQPSASVPAHPERLRQAARVD